MNKLIALITALTLSGCASPYSKFYTNRFDVDDPINSKQVIITQGEPKVIHSSNTDEKIDSQKMTEDNYIYIGCSSFNSGETDESGAIDQAKKIHASVVILYSKYTNTVSGNVPITLPNQQTFVTHSLGHSTTTTMYGNTTSFIPYNVNISNYIATYWIQRNKNPALGLYVIDISQKIKQEIQSNKGGLVYAVIKDSPAFNANLLKDDVIKKIGDTEIIDSASYSKAVEKYAGQKVILSFYRSGKEQEKEVQLNK